MPRHHPDHNISAMSWTKRILITLASLLAILVLLVTGAIVYDVYERWRVTQFYEARPILREMNAQRMSYSEEDQKRREVLFKFVPVGSSSGDAIKVLSAEGMRCSSAKDKEKRLLVCDLQYREPCHLIPRWHIEVSLDESDKVSSGRVLSLKATC